MNDLTREFGIDHCHNMAYFPSVNDAVERLFKEMIWTAGALFKNGS